MKKLRPKKYLGQHFLNDTKISKKITEKLDLNNTQTIVEVGPGMGILTENLVKLDRNCFFVEIDNDAVSFLKKKYITISGSILNQDFLKLNLKKF